MKGKLRKLISEQEDENILMQKLTQSWKQRQVVCIIHHSPAHRSSKEGKSGETVCPQQQNRAGSWRDASICKLRCVAQSSSKTGGGGCAGTGFRTRNSKPSGMLFIVQNTQTESSPGLVATTQSGLVLWRTVGTTCTKLWLLHQDTVPASTLHMCCATQRFSFTFQTVSAHVHFSAQQPKTTSGCRCWTAACLLMPKQQRHPGKGLGTAVTLVLLNVRMSLQMGTEVGAVCKCSAAVGAGVGLLTWKRNLKENQENQNQEFKRA